jgi:hypothetical protein
MNTISQIVSGGGWKSVRVKRLKVKAWITLFIAIGLGCASMLSTDKVSLYASIASGLSLIISVVLFIRERPIEFEDFSDPVGEDPRKLYGSCGGTDFKPDGRSAEPLLSPRGQETKSFSGQ